MKIVLICLGAAWLLTGCVDQQEVAGKPARPARHFREPDYPQGWSMAKPHKYKRYPDGSQDWGITSDTLDIASADSDARAQAKAGNCRLLSEGGWGRISYMPAGDKDFSDIEPIYGVMVVADTSDYITPHIRKALDITRAYGEVYNTTIVGICDYDPKKVAAWRSTHVILSTDASGQ